MPSLWYQLRQKGIVVWAALLIVLSVGLCALPLLGVLGYEFSLALAVVTAFAASHVGVLTVSSTRQAPDALLLGMHSQHRTAFAIAGRSLVLAGTLLAAPLALICLNALRVRNCNLALGFAFFAVLPVCTAIIASVQGTLWGLLLRRTSMATAAALATVVASLLAGVYRFYAADPVFVFEPFAGFFAGAIYDERVTIRAALLWSRTQDLSWIAFVLLAAGLWLDRGELRLRWQCLRPRRRGTLLTAGAGVIALTLTALGGHLGFRVGAHRIADALGGRHRTEHFDLLYPAEWPPERVQLATEDHEFRYHQLANAFGNKPRRIRSYIFRSADEKRQLVGSGNVFIAKPWRNAIYLVDASFPHPALKHELAHIFARPFGDRTFGISLAWRHGLFGMPYPRISVGLTEGLAVAMDWHPYGELDGHQHAAALERLQLAPPLAQLFGVGFWEHASQRSYTAAGAFCRYLLEQYGAQKLLALYRSAGNFDQVYRRSLPKLLTQWEQFLDEQPVPPEQMQLAEQTFRRPSIFSRVCPHEIARLRGRARALRSRGKLSQAADVWRSVCELDPGNPAHLFHRIAVIAAARGPAAALALAPTLLDHPALSKPAKRAALERIADLRWQTGAIKEAAERYDQAAAYAAGPASRRVLALKRLALKQRPALRTPIMRYLVPDPRRGHVTAQSVYWAELIRQRWPESGLGSYLIGKQLAAAGACSDALAPLQQALDRPLPTDDFRIEAYRALGTCQYRAGALADARQTWQTLAALPKLARGTQLGAQDWIARAEWKAHETGRGAASRHR